MDFQTVISKLWDFLITIFHLFFRWFPLTLLLRRSVEVLLFLSEVTLAFWIDYSRLWERFSLKSSMASAEQETEAGKESNDKPDEPPSKELRPRSLNGFFSYITSAISRLAWYLIKMAYYLTNLLNIFVILPWLNVQVFLLMKLNKYLSKLAGLTLYKNGAQRRRRKFITKHLIGYPRPPSREMKPTKFLLDSVIMYYISVIMENDSTRTLFRELAIPRRLKTCRNLRRFIVKKMETLSSNSLAPDLKTDPSHSEKGDEDLKHLDESSDDDFQEYAEDSDDSDADSSAQDADNKDKEDGGKETRSEAKKSESDSQKKAD